ncbi:MAG TPA: hypothetical protein VGD08_11310 [Stellaceae bacterium]
MPFYQGAIVPFRFPHLKIAAACVLMAGCAGFGAAQWQRDGAPSEQVSADLAQCRSEARRVVDRDVAIDQDILSTRSTDWQNSNTLTVRRDVMQAQNRGRADDIISRCMRAKGYSPLRD